MLDWAQPCTTSETKVNSRGALQELQMRNVLLVFGVVAPAVPAFHLSEESTSNISLCLFDGGDCNNVTNVTNHWAESGGGGIDIVSMVGIFVITGIVVPVVVVVCCVGAVAIIIITSQKQRRRQRVAMLQGQPVLQSQPLQMAQQVQFHEPLAGSQQERAVSATAAIAGAVSVGTVPMAVAVALPGALPVASAVPA